MKIWNMKFRMFLRDADKKFHKFGKPNVRCWQVLVANQIITKIMTYQIYGLANFESQPIKLFIYSIYLRLSVFTMNLTFCS
jgi:hypothetical protein